MFASAVWSCVSLCVSDPVGAFICMDAGAVRWSIAHGKFTHNTFFRFLDHLPPQRPTREEKPLGGAPEHQAAAERGRAAVSEKRGPFVVAGVLVTHCMSLNVRTATDRQLTETTLRSLHSRQGHYHMR